MMDDGWMDSSLVDDVFFLFREVFLMFLMGERVI